MERKARKRYKTKNISKKEYLKMLFLLNEMTEAQKKPSFEKFSDETQLFLDRRRVKTIDDLSDYFLGSAYLKIKIETSIFRELLEYIETCFSLDELTQWEEILQDKIAFIETYKNKKLELEPIDMNSYSLNQEFYAMLYQEYLDFIVRLANFRFDERQRRVFFQRLGIDGRPKTLQQIGDDLGVTKERIRQIYNKCADRFFCSYFYSWDAFLLRYEQCCLIEKVLCYPPAEFLAYICLQEEKAYITELILKKFFNVPIEWIDFQKGINEFF